MADLWASKMEPHAIKSVPPSMSYVPNFITETEEAFILDKIPPNQWISLTHRRLQAIPARLTVSNALVASKGLPEWLLQPVVARITEMRIFKDSPHGTVNHCLINEYLPGQGIMPHEDGAAYYPVVATISLGSSLVLDVCEKVDNSSESNDRASTPKRWRILQEPRSLLVTTGSAYTEALHGIAEVEEDVDLNGVTVANWDLLADKETIVTNGGKNERKVRISLTLRDVLKVSNVGSKIFGKQRT